MKTTINRKAALLCLGLMLVSSAILLSACSQGETKGGQQTGTRSDSSSTAIAKAADKEGSTKADSSWLLIPGHSAGQTKLNSKTEELISRLGKPDGGDAAMGKTVSVWFNDHDRSSNSLAVFSVRSSPPDESYKVRQIRVTSPQFKTPEGIHTGTALTEIRRAYPVVMTETYRDKGKTYSLFDSDKGIAFEVGPDSVCVSIIVHEKGLERNTTYLKFRTTG